MTLRSTLAIAALCLTSAAAFAQAPAATPPPTNAPATPESMSPEAAKRWEACKADVAKFCATEAAAKVKGEVGKCLKSHTAELSAGCVTARAEHDAAKAAAKATEAPKPAQ